MTRDEGWSLLTGWTKSDALRRHALAVEAVMRALARRSAGADEDLWGLAGLLHDADYEAYPDEHPRRTVAWLRERGEDELAHAVSAHYTKWGVPAESPLDRALLAADELTGFVVACSLVHPDGIGGLTPESVAKKLRQKGFAAKVDRDEIRLGAEACGLPVPELAGLIIGVLRDGKSTLGLR
jgi:predicted hydrolase (HD superfamily)